MAQKLLSIAEKYKLAVVVTNQVTTKFNRPSFAKSHIHNNYNVNKRTHSNDRTNNNGSNGGEKLRARIAPALGQR
jgi:hypothetical protein